MYARAIQQQSAGKLRIVASGGLGDCLLVTPFIRHFKEVLDYGYIECWCPESARNLFENNPYIDRLLAFRGNNLRLGVLPEQQWDVFAPYFELTDGHGELERIMLQRGRNLVDLPLVTQIGSDNGLGQIDPRMKIFPTAADLRWSASLAKTFGPPPVVLLNGLSRLPAKDLPAASLVEIRDQLADMTRVLIMGGCDTVSRHGNVITMPLPTLRQSAALFAHLAAVVTVDSFPAHLAAAMGVPAVVLYGPTNPACWAHPGQVALRPTACPVCEDSRRLGECRTIACMKEITPRAVIRQVQMILSGTATSAMKL